MHSHIRRMWHYFPLYFRSWVAPTIPGESPSLLSPKHHRITVMVDQESAVIGCVLITLLLAETTHENRKDRG